MTPEGQIAPGLLQLLDRMREISKELNAPFNAVLYPTGKTTSGSVDVSRLQLMDNATEYECVCEAEDCYDIWESGHILHEDITLELAALILLERYHTGKMRRVVERVRRKAERN